MPKANQDMHWKKCRHTTYKNLVLIHISACPCRYNSISLWWRQLNCPEWAPPPIIHNSCCTMSPDLTYHNVGVLIQVIGTCLSHVIMSLSPCCLASPQNSPDYLPLNNTEIQTCGGCPNLCSKDPLCSTRVETRLSNQLPDHKLKHSYAWDPLLAAGHSIPFDPTPLQSNGTNGNYCINECCGSVKNVDDYCSLLPLVETLLCKRWLVWSPIV